MAETYPSRSLHGSIVHQLGKRIVLGEYAPHSTLPVEDVLREELNVSRNALREAIKVLSAKGLLKVKTRTGTCVQPKENWHMTDPDVLAWATCGKPDKDFFARLTEFRNVIEPAACALAAANATEEERDEIRARLKALEAAHENEEDFEKSVQIDMAFHQAIFSATHNPFLQSVANHVSTALAKSRKITYTVPGARQRALADHQEVGNAVADGRVDDARRAMEHLCGIVAGDVEEAFKRS